MSKKLFTCGASKRCITPDKELLKNLSGLMGKSFSGVVFDQLYLRVIALCDGENRALLVEHDLDKAPNPKESLEALERETGVPQENILYFGIHTHTAPITGVRPDEGMNSRLKKPPQVQAAMEKYEAFLLENLLSAAKEALGAMQPARVGWTLGESYIGVNRCADYAVKEPEGALRHCCSLGVNPKGPVDHTLFVWKAETYAGEPIAIFINYPVHCCVMITNDSDGQGNVGISGDIAGVTAQLVEKACPGAVALWSSGAAGDVNPIMMNQYYYPDPDTGACAEFHVSGAECAQASLRLLTMRHFADIQAAQRALSCDKTEAQIRCTAEWSYTPGRDVIGKRGEISEIRTGPGVAPYGVRVHPMVIGDMALVGISGELYTSLAKNIQEASPMKHTCIVNHDACLMARSGYIFDDETLRRCAQNDKDHFMPGLNQSRILPGYVAESLRKHTEAAFTRLFS